MSYLCIFDGDFAYYNESDYFKEGESYILEKSASHFHAHTKTHVCNCIN